MNLPKLTFVLGGAASGKSHFAESLCISSELKRVYIATAQSFDDEMRTKIISHQQDRGGDWQTIEEPLAIAEHIKSRQAGEVVLIDCATMWLTNLVLGEHDIAEHTQLLLMALAASAAPVVIVSNEVGQGIVPDNALARAFRNAQGRLNAQIAAQCELAVQVIAGLPRALKGNLPQ